MTEKKLEIIPQKIVIYDCPAPNVEHVVNCLIESDGGEDIFITIQETKAAGRTYNSTVKIPAATLITAINVLSFAKE